MKECRNTIWQINVFALFVIAFILLNFNIRVLCQTTFNKYYDNFNSNDGVFCVFETSDHGYILAGTSYISTSGWQGSFIIRTDCNGDTIWKKVFDFSSTGADGFEYGFQDTDGCFVLTGAFQDTILLNKDAFIVKLDKYGNVLWFKSYGGNQNESGYMIKKHPDGGFVMSGFTSSFTNGNTDFYIIKTDNNGNFQWQNHYGGTGDDICYSFDYAKDGGYILGGRTDSYGLGGVDLYMIKVNNAGNFQWQKTFGTTGNDYSETVISILDSGYVMVGGIADSYGSYDSYMVKTDSLGIKIWDKVYGRTPNNEGLKYVVQLLDSSFTLSGSMYVDNTVKWQAWLLKTNKNGDSLWSKTYGNSGVNDYIYDMCKTTDSGYALAGQYNRIGPPYQDMWLIKTDSLGCDQPICNFGCNACAYIQPHIWVFSDTVFLPNKSFSFQDSIDFALHWFWDFGDGTTDTVQNPVHVYDTTGTYTVKLIAYYGNCSDSVLMNVYVINNTGIDINSSDIPFKCKIFPNPAKDLLYVRVRGVIQSPFTITIYNIQGKTVKQVTTKQNENVIDISGLEQGVYGVRVVGDFNVVERFVKM